VIVSAACAVPENSSPNQRIARMRRLPRLTEQSNQSMFRLRSEPAPFVEANRRLGEGGCIAGLRL